MLRGCVYKVLTGSYESLNEADVAADSTWDFICFTDNPDLRSKTWKIRQFKPPFSHDHVRNARYIKACPHRFLPEYEVSLWIDNTVELRVPPETFVPQWLDDAHDGWVAVHHSHRDTLHEEFERVLQVGLDEPARIREQFNVYKSEHPDLMRAKPIWTGLVLRRHHLPSVIAVGDLWFAHICRYAKRDQLSLPYVLESAGVKPKMLTLHIRKSDFHLWNSKSLSRNNFRREQGWKEMLPVGLLGYYLVERVWRRLFRLKLKLDGKSRQIAK